MQTSTLDRIETTVCPQCEGTLVSGTCVNVNCSTAVEEATKDAGRKTAKATGDATVVRREPRSFNLSGRVD